jgi:hypothetical protein
MSKAQSWVGLGATGVLLIGILASGVPATPGLAQAPARPQVAVWEYKFVEVPHYLNEYQTLFSDLGTEGWEYCETREFLKINEQKVISNARAVIFKRQGRLNPLDAK